MVLEVFWFKGPGSHWPGVFLVAVDFSEPSPAISNLGEKVSRALRTDFPLYQCCLATTHQDLWEKNGACLPLTITVHWSPTMCTLSLYFRQTEWVDAEISTKLEHFGNESWTHPNPNASEAWSHWAVPQCTLAMRLIAWTMGTSQRKEILPSGHCCYIGTSLTQRTSSANNTNTHMSQC